MASEAVIKLGYGEDSLAGSRCCRGSSVVIGMNFDCGLDVNISLSVISRRMCGVRVRVEMSTGRSRGRGGGGGPPRRHYRRYVFKLELQVKREQFRFLLPSLIVDVYNLLETSTSSTTTYFYCLFEPNFTESTSG